MSSEQPESGIPGALRRWREGARQRWQDASQRDRWLLGGGAALILMLVVGGIAAVLLTGGSGTGSGAPRELSVSPSGEEAPRLGPIVVSFVEPPRTDDPERLVSISPHTEGTYAWLDERTLLFQPDFPGLQRGALYQVVVDAGQAGITQDLSHAFTVEGKLAVRSVIPSAQDADVPPEARVFVQFSRAVAPLTLLAAQPTDQVVTFDPPLAGAGEWLNTSMYVFTPADLRPSTTYSATIAAGLSSEADGVLEQDYEWQFSTYQPAVVRTDPEDGGGFVAPADGVKVEFNQPMDHASTEAGIHLRPKGGGDLATRSEWSDDSSVVTVTPADSFAISTTYELVVDEGLAGAVGGATQRERVITFSTVDEPRLVSSSPRAGETQAGRYGVSFEFNQPVDADMLEERLSISGIDPKQWTVDSYDGVWVNVGVTLEPSTAYTVTIAEGVMTRAGLPLPRISFTFTTGALPPQVAYAVSGGYSPLATYAASGDQELLFYVTNLPSADFELYRLTDAEAKGILDSGGLPKSNQPNDAWKPPSAPLRTWSVQAPDARNAVALGTTNLGGDTPLAKGYYYVRSPGFSYGAQLMVAVVDTEIVTKLATEELMVWALDHDTGTPVSGLTLRFTGPGLASSSATTDADGVASVGVSRPSEVQRVQREYAVTTDSTTRFGAARTDWTSGSEPWALGLPISYIDQTQVAHVYTDRPIYRSGETAHFKAIVRVDSDATYSLPPAGDTGLLFVVTDAQGEEIDRRPIEVNEFGTFAGELVLPEEASTGFYSVSVRDTSLGYENWIASGAFQVAEFRTPEFRVELTPRETEYVDGDTIEADLETSFFFGGPLEGVQVTWTAHASPTGPRFPGFERYSFSDYDRFRTAIFDEPQRAEGEAVTDAQGRASINVPGDLRAGESTTAFTVSATVTDQSGQAIGADADVVIHPASVYAGVATSQYVGVVGEPVEVRVASVNIDGTPALGRSVTVDVYEREWITVKEEAESGARRYRSEPDDTLLETLTITTDAAGLGTAPFAPSSTGELRLVARVTDAQGRTARSASGFWVGGGEFARWQVRNDSLLPLVADRESYEVGDTAEVLIPAPFAGTQALITIERGGVLQRETRFLAGNSETLRIPVEDGFIPNVFVSVVLYRPPTGDDSVPRYHVGYVELRVSTEPRTLTVDLQPSVEQAAPGETVRYDITVRDAAGQPVEAELSVDMVDAAVLSLSDLESPTGLQAFWFQRGLGVRTGSSLAVSIDRSNDTVPEPGFGGKGGGDEGDALRSNFQNTAYWEAQLRTDAAGRASFEVTLPDNLTTWTTEVRAISGDTLVGQAAHDLVSTRSLLVRPALPRFLRVGDDVTLRTLVRNATDEAREVLVAIEVEGVDLAEGGTQRRTVQPGESGVFAWPATAGAAGTASVTFRASAGDLTDGASIELPVYLDVTPETVATGGVVTTESAVEALYLPDFAILDNGSLEVRVQSSLVGALDGELSELALLPWESTVHTASRVMGTLAARRAEGVTGAALMAGVEDDLRRLQAAQRVSGGWGWCASGTCTADPAVTGWVLVALGEARAAGWDTAPWASKGGTYLRSRLSESAPSGEAAASKDQRAFYYYALQHAAGDGDYLNSALSLYEHNMADLDPWGRAYLVLALLQAGQQPDSAAVRGLVAGLNATVIPSANGNHWEGASERGSIESNVSMTALVLRALVAADSRHPLIEQTVRWLVAAREAQRWQSDVQRAQAMMALGDYAALTGERRGEFDYRVALDGNELLAGRFGGSTLSAEQTRPLADLTKGEVHRLAFERETSAGRMYYLLNLRYVTPAAEVEALSRGISIAHQYSRLSGADATIAQAGLGEIVRVTLTIMSDADRKFVQVSDLLPAGLEAIDAQLATVPGDVRRQLEADRRDALAGDAEDGAAAPWYPWYWSPWDETQVRDDRFTLFATELPRGVHEYVYYARATTPGDFFVAPAHVEEAAFPEVFGRSDSGRFTVTP